MSTTDPRDIKPVVSLDAHAPQYREADEKYDGTLDPVTCRAAPTQSTTEEWPVLSGGSSARSATDGCARTARRPSGLARARTAPSGAPTVLATILRMGPYVT
jgi:hypothetical protein